jgi:hypothetical protein
VFPVVPGMLARADDRHVSVTPDNHNSRVVQFNELERVTLMSE